MKLMCLFYEPFLFFDKQIIMKFKHFFVALAIGAYSCTGTNTQGDGSVEEIMVGGNKVFVCVLDKVKSGTVTIPLSSLVEDFEMVQLETKGDAFFNPNIAAITFSENYIGVCILNDNYKLFDRSGKFLCTLSRRGRVPGEYPFSLNDAIIDEKNGLVYLAAVPGKILVYSISCQFLKEIVAPPMSFPKIFLSDGILSLVHDPRMYQHQNNPPVNEANAIMYKFDIKTDELLEKIAPPFEHLIVRKVGAQIFSAQNVPGVFDFFPDYFETDQYDTLYHIDVKKNKFQPFFAMQYNFTKARDKPIFFQLNKDLMMITLKETTPAGYYVEKDLIATNLKNKTSQRVKIVNDYLGDINAVPKGYHSKFHRGYYVCSIQPEELMENIEKRLAERTCTEADREVLKKTLSKLKEGTNNVVLFGKLKGEIATKLW